VDELETSDQLILKLFNEGKTDAAIAEIVKKSRSMVQMRRKQLIEELKEKVKKFE
jgi:DNA-directed RNA polymerase specialized sigma subunit